MQYLRRELPPSRRLCCLLVETFPSGVVRAPRSPYPHPTRSAQRPALGGLPGSGRFRRRVRGRSRPAFPPSIHHQWETGDAGAPGLGRVVAAAVGLLAAEAGSSPSSARSRARNSRSFPPAGRVPTLGLQLASWALGRFTAAGGRSQGSGAPGFGLRHGGCLHEVPEPQPAWCGRPRPPEHRGRGCGPGSGARLHPRGVWITP